ncbi:MAG: helix-turn-helix transcriptional regulator [Clostridia bacterium]|nr:helix-turn-helix transcriptional regulator [Clostridia bacterium]
MRVIVADVDNIQDENFKLHRPNGREDYLFVLFKSPSFVMVDGSYISADAGDCIIFDKYKIQSYFPEKGRKFCHDYIHFNTESKAEERLLQGIPMGVTIKVFSPKRISSILKGIVLELSYASSKYTANILDNLTTVFIYQLKSELERDHASEIEKHYSDFLAIRNEIYISPEKSRSVEEVCKSVYLSRSYFQHLYKRFFAVSYVNDVISARIALAKKLLLNTELPICEVAENCGYKSTSHFIKQFGNVVGISPNKFRNK